MFRFTDCANVVNPKSINSKIHDMRSLDMINFLVW